MSLSITYKPDIIINSDIYFIFGHHTSIHQKKAVSIWTKAAWSLFYYNLRFSSFRDLLHSFSLSGYRTCFCVYVITCNLVLYISFIPQRQRVPLSSFRQLPFQFVHGIFDLYLSTDIHESVHSSVVLLFFTTDIFNAHTI